MNESIGSGVKGNIFLMSFQTRDWNEELQTTRELARKNLPERLLRERAIFKVPCKTITSLWLLVGD